MSSASPERPLSGRQREARSNDSRVLAAAREIFATQGRGASMADIASHAGVGIGSIYRRYPTKDSLVEALHLDGVREAAVLADDVATRAEDRESMDSGAVATFLSRQITEATGPILRPPGADGPLPPDLAAASEALRDGIDRLIALDRTAGFVPAGFTTADVMHLLLHLRPSLPYPREQADAIHLRYLGLIVEALGERARAHAELPDGPHWDDWIGAWHDSLIPRSFATWATDAPG